MNDNIIHFHRFNPGLEPLKICVPQGYQIVTEAIQTMTSWDYRINKSVFALAAQRLPLGAFVDVGANIGTETIMASELFKKLYAFEIDAGNLELLRRNIALNKIDCEVVCQGVSDVSGERLYIKRNAENVGGISLSLNKGEESTEVVETIALSDYPFRESIAYLHIDTEGMDAKVLIGAAGLFQRQAHPPIVRFEFAPYLMCKYGSSASDLIKFKETFGYEFYLKAPVQPSPISSTTLQALFEDWKIRKSSPWIDLYAFPPDVAIVETGE